MHLRQVQVLNFDAEIFVRINCCMYTGVQCSKFLRIKVIGTYVSLVFVMTQASNVITSMVYSQVQCKC